MNAHPHAENMLLYAEDAAETDKPWTRWECTTYDFKHWVELDTHPEWKLTTQYRRKPRTIRIGSFDVPEPMRKVPAVGARYWAVWLSADDGSTSSVWDGGSWAMQLLNRGLIHATREAAELHARALISLTAEGAK